MTRETVVVLGGGTSQLPYITALQALGFRVVSIDRDASAPAAKVAERFVVQSTHDLFGLKLAAEDITNDENVLLFFSNSSHPNVATNVAELNALCRSRVASYSPDAVALSYDKSRLKARWREVGLPTPAAWIYPAENRIVEQAFPCIVKPLSGMGSIGVALCRSGDELYRYLEHIGQPCLVEDYVDGPELSVDGVVFDGCVRVISVADKRVGAVGRPFLPKRFALVGREALAATYGDDMPYRIEEVTASALAAIGLDHSQFSFDIKIDTGGIQLIECGPFWDCRIDRLLSFAGFEPYGWFMRALLRRELGSDGWVSGAAMEFVYAEHAGVFDSSATRRNCPDCYWEFECRDGDPVVPPKSAADVIAYRFIQEATA